MNKMVRIVTPEMDELDAIERMNPAEQAEFVADHPYGAGFLEYWAKHPEHAPKRRVKPTPEQVAEAEAQARRRADSAMRGLIGLLPLTEDEKRFVRGIK